MLGFLLASVAAAGPAPVSVTMPGLNCLGVDSLACNNVAEYVATQLARPEFSVTTANDIAQILSIERQKQLLGCSDDANSCIAELAGALGTEILLRGSLSKSEGRLFLNLRFISAEAKPLAARALRADDLRALEAQLDREVPAMADELLGVVRPELLVKRRKFIAPTAVAGASVVAGAVLLVLAQGNARQLAVWAQSRADSLENIERTTNAGSLQQTLAWVCFGVGGAAAVAAVVTFILEGRASPPREPSVRALPIPGGALAVFSGALP